MEVYAHCQTTEPFKVHTWSHGNQEKHYTKFIVLNIFLFIMLY